MIRRGLFLCLLPIATGCGATGREYVYEDKEVVRDAFIDVVRAYCVQRPDGSLQLPVSDPNRVRFVYQYNRETNGADREWIDLNFSTELNPSPGSAARPVYRILVHQPVPGSNRVLDDRSREIAALMQEKLKPASK